MFGNGDADLAEMDTMDMCQFVHINIGNRSKDTEVMGEDKCCNNYL